MMDSVSVVMLRGALKVMKKNLLMHTALELKRYQKEHPDQTLEKNRIGNVKVVKESYRLDSKLATSISILNLLLLRLKPEAEECAEDSAFSRDWTAIRNVFIGNPDLNLDLEFLNQDETFDMNIADEFASKFMKEFPCKNTKSLKEMTESYKTLKDDESKKIVINRTKTFLRMLWTDVRIFANVHP